MKKTQATLLAILVSAAGTLSAQTAPGSDNASPMPQGSQQAEQSPKQDAGAAAPTSGATGSLDCPPSMNQGPTVSLDPAGPVGRTGGASAMVDDSGTIGSTGETRATTTSGATGTTGEFGGYREDPSGSVTAAGSTGGAIDPSIECGPDGAASGASDANSKDASGGGKTGSQQPVQKQ